MDKIVQESVNKTVSMTLPLVAAQTGIWIADQLANPRNAFTIAHYTEISGHLDNTLFDKAIRQGIAEADTVHARFFVNENNIPMQQLPGNSLSQYIDPPQWFDFTKNNDLSAPYRLMDDDLATELPADGDKPLYRHIMMKITNQPERWIWYQRYHHIVLDGFSFDMLTRRILAIYDALRHNRLPGSSPFTPFSKVVDEYSHWQHSCKQKEAAAFWKEYMRQQAKPVSLSFEQRPSVGWTKPFTCQCTYPISQFSAITMDPSLSRYQPVDILMAILAIYFYRLSGERHLSIGFPYMRRLGSAALCATGPVVNILPLQINLTDQMVLADVMQTLQREIKCVRRYQQYEAEQIRADLGLSGGSEALYGPVFNYKIYNGVLKLEGLTLHNHVLAMGPIDDLEFEFSFYQDQLYLTLLANPSKYSEQTLQRHSERITHLLAQVIHQPQQAIANLTIMTQGEQQLLMQWGQGARLTIPLGMTSVVDWLLHQVIIQPDAIAVRSMHQTLTYQQLSDNVMQLARLLIAKGIGADDIVAIGLPRTVNSVVAIFAVLASGAAYLPLDLDYPQQRLILMFADAKPSLLITTQQLKTKLPSLSESATICLDNKDICRQCSSYSQQPIINNERKSAFNPDHLAYIIYTSGSTGNPKGVMCTHRGLTNLITSHANLLIGPEMAYFYQRHQRRMRSGHIASFCFDSSWEPLFCMLLGGELYLFDEELRRDTWAIVQQAKQTPIDMLDITPSFLIQLIDSGLLADPESRPSFIIVGGEATSPQLWQTLQQYTDINIYNYYGPSEYTVDTLGCSLLIADHPLIGRPLANTTVWLLDKHLQPVPIGCLGELYISGLGLARGYLHRPDLTASRFVANPFQEGETMYRTGDIMRWSNQGQLEFIGRTDHQIKVRGFRIELGEIEDALSALPEVSLAVVIAKPHGTTYQLIGYCSVPDPQLRDLPYLSTQLLTKLSYKLPDYMVPALLVVLAELPLSVNGKIDRTALPEPRPTTILRGRKATTENEQVICQAFTTLLGLTEVSIEDDFFRLGGDSISAMALANQLRHSGWQLKPGDIFSLRTPEAMAKKLNRLIAPVHIKNKLQKSLLTHLPIVNWFTEKYGTECCFAHGIYLELPISINAHQLCEALFRLKQLHPALHARTDNNYLLIGEQPAQFDENDVSLWRVDQDIDVVAEKAFFDAIKKLVTKKGKLLHACLLQNARGSDYLVLVIHHLVVDGVSWRILLTELPQLINEIIKNQPCSLTMEQTTLAEWDNYLQQQVTKCREQLAFWQSMLPDKPLSDSPVKHHSSMRAHKRTLLTAQQTHHLLMTLPKLYLATVDEILLSLLFMAYCHQFNQQQLSLQLESHGRYARDNDIDLSRTVGWLTAEYPVTFRLTHSVNSPTSIVRAVKSVLRAVPDHGIGYGLLRYSDQESRQILSAYSQPTILFNYLGRFIHPKTGWQLRKTNKVFCDDFAVYLDESNLPDYSLEINLFVDEQPQGAHLAINWQWDQAMFTEQDIDQFAQTLVQVTEQFYLFAKQKPDIASQTIVASEVAIPGISDQDITQLIARHGPLNAILPLLPLQQGLLFHAQTTHNTGSYNSLTRLTFNNVIEKDQLQNALDLLVKRYPQLAARFDTEQTSVPLQLIPTILDGKHYWLVEYYQLNYAHANDEHNAIQEIEKKILQRDLFNQPEAMLQAVLICHSNKNDHTLFLNIHHLIVDGWSTPLLIQDLLTLLNGNVDKLVEPKVSYMQLIKQLSAKSGTDARHYWQQRLKQVKPTLLFGENPHEGEVKELTILLDPRMEQNVTQFCQQQGLTLNTVMQGVWGLLLSLHSASDDVVFGSPVSGRFGHIDGLAEQIGLFSNTLPVRIKFDMTMPLLPQLKQLQQEQIALLEYDNIGLAEIQQLAGTTTLFDTLFVVENYPDIVNAHSDDTIFYQSITNRGYTHYPLTLLVLPGKQVKLLMEYRSVVTEPQRLAKQLLLLLEQVVTQYEKPLICWQLQPEDDQFLIKEINNTRHDIPVTTLHELVIEQAKRTPDADALVDCQQKLSYRQMRYQVKLLAAQLINEGVLIGDRIAVALPRSVRLSIALQAIIEVGAAWLPLDISYPDDRLVMMIDDAKPRLVITEKAIAYRFSQHASLLFFDSLADEQQHPTYTPISVTANDTAYIIYTSGSTGRPKGVMINHQAIVNRLLWMQAAYPLQPQDVILQKTPSSFDVSVWEFFWPLITGATLMMAPPEAHKDPEQLVALIDKYFITTIHFVPSMLATLLDSLSTRSDAAPFCHSLRRVFCSGEVLSSELARRYQRLITAPLHNLYGPTEAAVDVTWHPANSGTPASYSLSSIPIGRPVWNTQLRILDPWLRPVPIGVAGDLYLSGIQLAIGYLGRPGLTASRFVADPFTQGERMYRTGDIARWLTDGTVEYLGRSDDQVKIRGQRIELGEIEQVLLEQPGIAQAVVGAVALGETGSTHRDTDNRQLIAWLILQSGYRLSSNQLQQALAMRLPTYMVPIDYLCLEQFPLSANGKLDRKSLPLPKIRHKGKLPNTKLEKQLAHCFCTLLACDTIYSDDDFFALGGHSLLAMRLAGDIRRQTGYQLSVGEIIVARTVEKLATLLTNTHQRDSAESKGFGEILTIREAQGITLFCVHPASGFAWQYSSLLHYLHHDWSLIGIQSPRPMGGIASCQSLDDVCLRYLTLIRQIQPHGPYYLLGYSLGGTLALAIAAKLQQAGEQVAFLGLLDTYPPEGQDWSSPSEDDVKQEIAHEQAAFMVTANDEHDAQLREEKLAMFTDIVANYKDAIRLLSTAKSDYYHGPVELFVATKTLPKKMNIQATWQPWITQLNLHFQECEHADILSPQTLETLGPLLNQLLQLAKR